MICSFRGGKELMKSTESESLISTHHDPFHSIIFFGPPGSGKGTLAKTLSAAGNHIHLSSGDIFRGLDPESGAGKLFHTYASKGHLVPDHVTVDIWHYYVKGLIATNRYFPKKQLLLLDGVPRTPAQAVLFGPYLEIAHIIVLEVEDIEVLIKRLQKRALIEGRMDDKEEKILRTRMEVYQRETVALLAHYPKSLISRFNADQKPLEVLRDVLVKLSSTLSPSK